MRRRVVVLADVRLYRDGLVGALAGYTELTLVGAGPVGPSGLDLVTTTTPDIVLLEATAACVPAIVQSILERARGATAPEGQVAVSAA